MELTQEQRDKIKELSNNELPENVYLEWLSMYNDFKLFDEVYSGQFNSDEAFAEDMAEQTGAIDLSDRLWPKYCIDWEYAARELMMDYFKIEGHYFRSM